MFSYGWVIGSISGIHKRCLRMLIGEPIAQSLYRMDCATSIYFQFLKFYRFSGRERKDFRNIFHVRETICLQERPSKIHNSLNICRWTHDLERRPVGSFLCSHTVVKEDLRKPDVVIVMAMAYEERLQIQGIESITEHFDSRIPSRINEVLTINEKAGSIVPRGGNNGSCAEKGNCSSCSFHFIPLAAQNGTLISYFPGLVTGRAPLSIISFSGDSLVSRGKRTTSRIRRDS